MRGLNVNIYLGTSMGCTKLTYQKNHFLEIIHSKKRASKEIKRVNYYPFGLKHKGYNNVVNGTDHQYGFGGKEEQNELGLNWIDVTARNYDPALGRWMNLDPLAEKMRRHSPYTFSFNNPIYFQDYDGMMPEGCCGDLPNPIGWLKDKAQEILTPIGEFAQDVADSFVLEGSGKIDIGLQAGAKVKVAGLVDAKVNVNLVSIDVVSGKADLTDPTNPDSYTGDYLGKDGNIDVNHSASLELGVAGKPLIGGDIKASHTSDSPDVDVDGGLYLAVPLTETKSRSGNRNSTSGPKDKALRGASGSSKTGKKGDFYGLNLGVGGALGVGFNINLKVGFNL